ncbi:hypothetical protein FSP39_001595 [Pinctada imbricata]|uniref:Mediator of RNA polymerase II transcription subunit 13 n=1 Tax=Pinctada imbricata TaxID=66713 RepID=A0AA88XVA7_PINIB|nr:hypothetical protein FSP39_001595 [Pinctada imbricata]
MSHSNPPGNGCSLEDCYTNLFALTDICGIKWKTLTADPATVDPLEDPVLQTYSKCINSDILCVWRRVTRQVEQPGSNPEQLTSSKELWIFWYGTEPENLKQILLRAALKGKNI